MATKKELEQLLKEARVLILEAGKKFNENVNGCMYSEDMRWVHMLINIDLALDEVQIMNRDGSVSKSKRI